MGFWPVWRLWDPLNEFCVWRRFLIVVGAYTAYSNLFQVAILWFPFKASDSHVIFADPKVNRKSRGLQIATTLELHQIRFIGRLFFYPLLPLKPDTIMSGFRRAFPFLVAAGTGMTSEFWFDLPVGKMTVTQHRCHIGNVHFQTIDCKRSKRIVRGVTSHMFMILTYYDEAEIMLRVKPTAYPRMIPKRVKKVPTIRNTTHDMKLYICESLWRSISNNNVSGRRRAMKCGRLFKEVVLKIVELSDFKPRLENSTVESWVVSSTLPYLQCCH